MFRKICQKVHKNVLVYTTNRDNITQAFSVYSPVLDMSSLKQVGINMCRNYHILLSWFQQKHI